MEALRLVHVSDTHNLLDEAAIAALPRGHIFLHTGDFSNSGTHEEFAAFNHALGLLGHLFPVRVVVLGNHDVRVFGNNFPLMQSLLSNATHVPCHQTFMACGLVFHGTPWWRGHRGDYSVRSGIPGGPGFDVIPPGVDVLLTHGPPLGVLDFARPYNLPSGHWGSPELRSVVLGSSRPGCHLFGHIHEHNGQCLVGSADGASCVLFVNSAMRSHRGKPRLCYSPHVVCATRAAPSQRWCFHVDES